MLTATFMDYALLKRRRHARDRGPADREPRRRGPFGAKGLGESGAIPVSAAVANAIQDAIGIRFTELPIAPAVVRAALERRRA